MDALLSGSAIDIEINQEPATAQEGNIYILGDNPVGKWKDKPRHITYFFQGWRFIVPQTGMSFFVVAKNALYRFIDNNWVKVG
jgi:hypothetical protein